MQVIQATFSNLIFQLYLPVVRVYNMISGQVFKLRGVLELPRTYLENEKEKSKKDEDGFLMKNFSNGVEVVCTEKFVKHWEKRGFKFIKRKPKDEIL